MCIIIYPTRPNLDDRYTISLIPCAQTHFSIAHSKGALQLFCSGPLSQKTNLRSLHLCPQVRFCAGSPPFLADGRLQSLYAAPKTLKTHTVAVLKIQCTRLVLSASEYIYDFRVFGTKYGSRCKFLDRNPRSRSQILITYPRLPLRRT